MATVAAPKAFAEGKGAAPLAAGRSSVIAGLDPAIHRLRENVLAKEMDPRVKPAGDIVWGPDDATVRSRRRRDDRILVVARAHAGVGEDAVVGDPLEGLLVDFL